MTKKKHVDTITHGGSARSGSIVAAKSGAQGETNTKFHAPTNPGKGKYSLHAFIHCSQQHLRTIAAATTTDW